MQSFYPVGRCQMQLYRPSCWTLGSNHVGIQTGWQQEGARVLVRSISFRNCADTLRNLLGEVLTQRIHTYQDPLISLWNDVYAGWQNIDTPRPRESTEIVTSRPLASDYLEHLFSLKAEAMVTNESANRVDWLFCCNSNQSFLEFLSYLLHEIWACLGWKIMIYF